MTSSTDINNVFISFFVILLFIVIFISLKTTLPSNYVKTVKDNLTIILYFIQQTNTLSLVVFIVITAVIFAKNLLTSFIAIILLILMFLIFRKAMFGNSVKYLNPYYEFTHKLVNTICAFSLIFLLWLNNPGNRFNSFFLNSTVLFAIILIFLLVIIGFIIYLNSPKNDPLELSKYVKSFNIMFGILFVIWLLFYIYWTLTNNSSDSKIKTFLTILFSLFIAGIFVFLIVKTYQTQFIYGNKGKVAFFDIIINTFLYIPCLIRDLSIFFIGIISSIIGDVGLKRLLDNIYSTSFIYWVILGAVILIILASYTLNNNKFFGLLDKIIYLNYTQLVEQPISLNTGHSVNTYDSLYSLNLKESNTNLSSNNSRLSTDNTTATTATTATTSTTHYNYRYGLSLWFFLDAYAPNTNSTHANYCPIINYGNKPLIEYNASTNSLRVCIGNAKNPHPQVVFEQRGVKLQKWINLVVNYDGGTVDVFMDGQLLKSIGGVAPYMSMDNLVIGGDNGIYGNVCNVIYSSIPFTLSNIYYIRYNVQNKNPPIFD